MELISHRRWWTVFLRWSVENSTSCIPRKCKELTLRKKGFGEELCKIHNILQCSELKLLGVIFQCNCKYASHVCEKLVKANKCLLVIRTLRQEGYNQEEQYSTDPLLRLSPPPTEILLAGNLTGELKSWIEIYSRRFSCCDFCLNVVPDWKQHLTLPPRLFLQFFVAKIICCRPFGWHLRVQIVKLWVND